MNNHMEIRFPAKPENEAFARAATAAFIAGMDPTVEELTEVKTGVSEAVSNAIIHGYGEDSEGEITLRCRMSADRWITIVVEDQGVGIEDVAQAREPMFTTGNEEERSGMGFTVMESFMDSLEVTSKPGQGTTVKMAKHLDIGHGL